MLLSRDGDRAMTPFIAVYDEGGGMSEPTPYEGEAFVFVLDGRIGVDFENGESVMLEEGDTAYIRTTGRRTYRNAGGGSARLLGVIARPAGA